MKKLNHRFVEYIPKNLEEGVLYISIRFGTAVHKCACGCGNKTVTPLSPTDWELKYNGESISLNPSIGNWSYPCQSHYWIINDEIRWADKWSKEKIQANRAKQQINKKRYFNSSKTSSKESESEDQSLWNKFKSWISNLMK
ncbi:hypothetical protein SAMN05443144_12722 [Fodinibius roseus]|uniref:Uncharacterized protein n=1 Tax=Fodinibius roseus TaxID=1194090 RepID=A0A1M5JID2_9BACT|nr:DUF6527 family protein [Fodinibius roseus]SHG40307.1 hypothetical protein SAMN05443144_12722 [Fodinibius roseus]